ncbi:Uncharacterised protein [Yersinia intermedia]|nr:Uncharacterised protein [Yersinia intermedia]CNH41807.1 Uncharacterised protein [Yersinia intermedia]
MNVIIKFLMVIFISYPLHTYSINIDKSINSHVDVSFSSMERFTHTLTARHRKPASDLPLLRMLLQYKSIRLLLRDMQLP